MGVDFSGSHKAMDTKQHEETYSAFIRVTIFGVVVCAAALVMLAIITL